MINGDNASEAVAGEQGSEFRNTVQENTVDACSNTHTTPKSIYSIPVAVLVV